MNPYLLTLSFLMLMSILTSSEVVRYSQNAVGNRLYNQYHESAVATEAVRAYSAFEDFRAIESEFKDEVTPKKKKAAPKPSSSVPRSTPLGFNFARPPNNSRLNLYLLLHEEPRKESPVSLYEATARLMRSLYGSANFFKPGIEYQILEALKEAETENFEYPDELATLTFNDPEAQNALYLMLKGTEGRPSLLNYITFDEKGSSFTKRVNLMFADPLVIDALLDNPEMTERLLAIRNVLWEKILDQEAHRLEWTRDQCQGRNELKEELKKEYKKILDDYGLDYEKNYKWVFDFALGKLGNILFHEDPHTGFIRREKHIPRTR